MSALLARSRAELKVATPGGLEPPTFSLEGCCSIRLSYGALREWWRGLLSRRKSKGPSPQPSPRKSRTAFGAVNASKTHVA
jgi:hypothetical protein